MGDWLPPLILACFSPPIEMGVISHLIYRIQSLFPCRANFLSGLTSYIAIVYLTIQKSKIYMYCLYNSRMLLPRDLTQHLTTRADDNHAPPVTGVPKKRHHYMPVTGMSRAGKVLRVASN